MFMTDKNYICSVCSYLAVLGIIQNTWEQWIVKEKISPVSDIWHGNLHPRKLECSKRRPLNFIVLLFCATSDMELNKFQAENWVTQNSLRFWNIGKTAICTKVA